MEGLKIFVDTLAGLAPGVVSVAALIALVVALAKKAGLVKPVDSGAFLTAPRASLLLNGLFFVVLLVARINGLEDKANELIEIVTKLLPLVVAFVGALKVSEQTHERVLKPAGLGAGPTASGA
jgi:hypothetical protein